MMKRAADSMAAGTEQNGRMAFNPLRFSLPPAPSAEARLNMIAKAAYFRAERRNFEPGHALEDWLAAEKEVDQQLAGVRSR